MSICDNHMSPGDYIQVDRQYLTGITETDIGVLVGVDPCIAIFRGKFYVVIPRLTRVIGSLIDPACCD